MTKISEAMLACVRVVASERFNMDQEDPRLKPFQHDRPGTDVFNQCIQAGLLRARHCDLSDSGSVELTPAGRLALEGEKK